MLPTASVCPDWGRTLWSTRDPESGGRSENWPSPRPSAAMRAGGFVLGLARAVGAFPWRPGHPGRGKPRQTHGRLFLSHPGHTVGSADGSGIELARV